MTASGSSSKQPLAGIARSCEFCDEFAGHGSAFSRLYAGVLANRVVARSESFVAFPTIGQIVSRYLLVASAAHIENLAALSPSQISELIGFVEPLVATLAGEAPWAMFEHGAAQASGGSCGIYHAHLHILALPTAIAISDVLPDAATRSPVLSDALSELRGTPEYLLFGTAGEYATLDVAGRRAEFPSQYFRRKISELASAPGTWDWRAISAPESALVETVRQFRNSSV